MFTVNNIHFLLFFTRCLLLLFAGCWCWLVYMVLVMYIRLVLYHAKVGY